MAAALQKLIGKIATAPTPQSLHMALMDGLGKIIPAQRWGLYLYHPDGSLATVEVQGMSNVETFVDLYQTVGRDVDPVLQYVSQNHAPAHEALLLPPGGWHRSDLYQNCCGYYGHEHIMEGPIFGSGSDSTHSLIGGLYFAKTGSVKSENIPPFTTQDLLKLSAICHHFSARLAELERGPDANYWASLLTDRDLEITRLIAQGLNNRQIGQQLYISPNTVKQTLKRIFRKVGVSARAELVAKVLSPKIDLE